VNEILIYVGGIPVEPDT